MDLDTSDTAGRLPLSRRAFLVQLAAGGAALGLLAACGGGSAAPSASPSSSTALTVPQTLGSAAAAASPASPSSAASVAGAPKGKLTYVWHTTITPAWLDPQENPAQITPYNFAYALHDALVKHLPGKPQSPSLAESYEVAKDYKSATFKLRPGIKFHDGSPVTPEDVQFTFEKYRGANAKILHDKTDKVEIVDKSTVRFVFKEPFIDFMTLYGTPASGAGWIVPKAYYEKVGPNGFKQKPIGAGPYKFVQQKAGTEVEFEANTEYWRKVPSIKTIVMKGVAEGATRVAMIQSGEADVVNLIEGPLIETVKRDSKLRMVAIKSGPIWLEPMAFDKPDSPLKDVRVRQAISLAIDRKAINDAEMGGLAPAEGNWIPEDYPGAISRPTPAHDPTKAKQLLAEAGVPNGFEISQITPLPPYFSMAERIASQLATIGIRTKVNTMERGAYYDKLASGPDRLKGLVMQLSGQPGDAAIRVRENTTCAGFFSGVCLPDIDNKVKQYDASTNLEERSKLLNDVQSYILDNYIIIPILRQAFIHAVGPRIANKVEDVEGSIPQYVYLGPYEDVQLKD
ncbi:MAG TPA: ABC transporter substrate-binding protein [Chloroflexota bacterium]|nr:ABC transporter substrate-binding protein [Chloroflexota bacterium]